jgi:hypothetical protein
VIAAVAATVIAPACEATTVKTSSTTTSMTAAMLGKSGYRCGNEDERSDCCKKTFGQGAFPHVSSLHRTRLAAREGKPPFTKSYAYWTPIPRQEVVLVGKRGTQDEARARDPIQEGLDIQSPPLKTLQSPMSGSSVEISAFTRFDC